MLKLPQKYTNDEKANSIIAQYLNGNIIAIEFIYRGGISGQSSFGVSGN